jgi:hypothetical protein
MTTKLNKAVKRQTLDSFPERGRYGKARPIVIELTPNNLIGVRYLGKRTTFYIESQVLLNELEWRDAKRIAKDKRDKKKRKEQ